LEQRFRATGLGFFFFSIIYLSIHPISPLPEFELPGLSIVRWWSRQLFSPPLCDRFSEWSFISLSFLFFPPELLCPLGSSALRARGRRVRVAPLFNYEKQCLVLPPGYLPVFYAKAVGLPTDFFSTTGPLFLRSFLFPW